MLSSEFENTHPAIISNLQSVSFLVILDFLLECFPNIKNEFHDLPDEHFILDYANLQWVKYLDKKGISIFYYDLLLVVISANDLEYVQNLNERGIFEKINEREKRKANGDLPEHGVKSETIHKTHWEKYPFITSEQVNNFLENSNSEDMLLLLVDKIGMPFEPCSLPVFFHCDSMWTIAWKYLVTNKKKETESFLKEYPDIFYKLATSCAYKKDTCVPLKDLLTVLDVNQKLSKDGEHQFLLRLQHMQKG
jgi:hypothetical protein